MLSFFVRPLTVGTVIGGSLAALESLALDEVLDAAWAGAVPVVAAALPGAADVPPGSETLATSTPGVVDEVATIPSGGI
jgi:hypothetical protein